LSLNIGAWSICRGRRYLAEIVSEIQDFLEEKGKQMVVPVYHNGTDRIVFGKNRELLHFVETRESAAESMEEAGAADPVLEMVAAKVSVSKQDLVAIGGVNETQIVGIHGEE